nr:hypothetical protein [uncultured Bacteroides sp.]
MESQIKYIELKTGYADDGPAWIGKVEFSKSGITTLIDMLSKVVGTEFLKRQV